MAEKMALQKEFERLYGDVDKLFKPVYDAPGEKFMEAIAELQKKGVSIIDVNNVTQRAYAQPNNYSDNSEMRVLIVGSGAKLKFYRIEHSRDADMDLSDGEQKLSQEEFEKLCIPTYSQPNPLLDKESTKLDYNPKQEDVEGSKAGPRKDMSVKKDGKAVGVKPDHPEIKKKTVEYGDTSSPKNKIKDDAGLTEGKFGYIKRGDEIDMNESFVTKIQNAINEVANPNKVVTSYTDYGDAADWILSEFPGVMKKLGVDVNVDTDDYYITVTINGKKDQFRDEDAEYFMNKLDKTMKKLGINYELNPVGDEYDMAFSRSPIDPAIVWPKEPEKPEPTYDERVKVHNDRIAAAKKTGDIRLGKGYPQSEITPEEMKIVRAMEAALNTNAEKQIEKLIKPWADILNKYGRLGQQPPQIMQRIARNHGGANWQLSGGYSLVHPKYWEKNAVNEYFDSFKDNNNESITDIAKELATQATYIAHYPSQAGPEDIKALVAKLEFKMK